MSTTSYLEEGIPYSATVLRDYRDGLKSLADDCEKFHNELLAEVEAHMERLDSAVLGGHFRRWRRDHKEALSNMLSIHRGIIRDVNHKLAKEYPELPK
jgi:hypothetical protein